MRYISILLSVAALAVWLPVRSSHGEAGAPPAYVFAEAEEFEVTAGDWKAADWGTNYYAASFANSFLSRQRYLGGPEQGAESVAVKEVEIPQDGVYYACVRYEAAYNFETRFGLRIDQGGKEILKRAYGAMADPKLWAFALHRAPKEKILPQVRWYWGPVENIVWEGTAVSVTLKKGKAKLTLSKGPQPGPAARRNIDLVMLTTDKAEMDRRIEKENYLPLDGLLTQAGDLFLKIKNPADAKDPVVVYSPTAREHSPYWVHIRKWRSVWIDRDGAHPKFSENLLWILPGEESPWVEIGSMMDALNVSGYMPQVRYLRGNERDDIDVEFLFGTPGPDGKLQIVRHTRYKDPTTRTAKFAIPGGVRYGKAIQTWEELLEGLLAEIRKFPPKGLLPRQILFFNTFLPGQSNSRTDELMLEICMALGNNTLNDMTGWIHPDLARAKELRFRQTGKLDVRGVRTEDLKKWLREVREKGQWPYLRVISLGDEIGLGAPRPGPETDEKFRAHLQSQGLSARSLLPKDAIAEEDTKEGRWQKVTYSLDKEAREKTPRLFYHAMRFRYDHGIERLRQRTQILEEGLPKGVLIGANYSPHPHYYPHYFQWVELFRQRAMTLPWSEDYLWQIPVTSQQVLGYLVTALRCGAQKHNLPIYMYVMPHTPGNTPASFRRAFYVDVANGAKHFDFFSPVPTAISYTENNMLPESIDMYRAIYDVIREAGLFEEFVFPGKVRPADVAILLTGTTDIWNASSLLNAERQHLYLALKHSKFLVDVIAEDDILEGQLKNYRIVYMVDSHLRRDAARMLAKWARRGGDVFAVAGAGMRDEYNEPNEIMQELLGVRMESLETSVTSFFGKDTLPRLAPMDTISYKTSRHAIPGTIDVYGAKATYKVLEPSAVGKWTGIGKTAEVLGTFKDGSPALFLNKLRVGKALTCAALPGTAYAKPAIPDRPCDRGSTDDAFAHFLPTRFDLNLRTFIAMWAFAAGAQRPILTSEDLVETSWIESRKGIAIPLINYTGQPLKSLEVRVLDAGTVRHVSSAVQGQVEFSTERDQLIVKLPLDVADLLMLRRHSPRRGR